MHVRLCLVCLVLALGGCSKIIGESLTDLQFAHIDGCFAVFDAGYDREAKAMRLHSMACETVTATQIKGFYKRIEREKNWQTPTNRPAQAK